MNYYEIDFSNEWSICIKGLRKPTIGEAAIFCAPEVTMHGPVLAVTSIEHNFAKDLYDFSNEAKWPVFGASK